MHEYLHLNPNFGKHKIIPFLLLLPVLAFVLVFLTSKKQIEAEHVVAVSTAVPEVKHEVKINDLIIPVEIADTDIKRSNGLSNRPPLDEGTGMLFIFPMQNVQTGFWMKEMYFDIDIIWINDGKIAQIHESVPAPEPGTSTAELKLYIPDDPIDYVLEMNAGSAQNLNIKVGDTVTLPTL